MDLRFLIGLVLTAMLHMSASWASDPHTDQLIDRALSHTELSQREVLTKKALRQLSPPEVYSYFSDLRGGGDVTIWAAEVLSEMTEQGKLPDTLLEKMNRFLIQSASQGAWSAKSRGITAFYQSLGFHFPPVSDSEDSRRMAQALEKLEEQIKDLRSRQDFDHATQEFYQIHPANIQFKPATVHRVSSQVCSAILETLGNLKKYHLK